MLLTLLLRSESTASFWDSSSIVLVYIAVTGMTTYSYDNYPDIRFFGDLESRQGCSCMQLHTFVLTCVMVTLNGRAVKIISIATIILVPTGLYVEQC